MNKIPLLLAPAGDFASLVAALQNGADAVYFAVGSLNMRAGAKAGFSFEELPEAVALCHQAGAKAWLTINVIVYDKEISEVEKLCSWAKECKVDAIIAADWAVVLTARKFALSVHLSVQANVSNFLALEHYSQWVDAVVLARELPLSQISAINEKIKERNLQGPGKQLIQTEVFVHGALCIGISGRCGLSLAAYNSSANRGKCFQNCRRTYELKDTESGFTIHTDGPYLLSPKDICLLQGLQELISSGVGILKIEGRGRSADYTAVTTAVYREALDSYKDNKLPTEEQEKLWLERLSSVFNRGFWHGGYYLGKTAEMWAKSSDNQATEKRELIGEVENYYNKNKIVEIIIHSGELKISDEVLIIGRNTGAQRIKITELRQKGEKVKKVSKAEEITFPCPVKVRAKDKVYKLGIRE